MKTGVAALFGAMVIGLFVADGYVNGSPTPAPPAAAPNAAPQPQDGLEPPTDSSVEGPQAVTAKPAGSSRLGPTVLVSRVIDGDTIEVLLQGRTVDVRFIGIDTPETVHPTVGVECYGPAASNFTERRLEGERVVLEFDMERTDRYGRILAYVWRDGILFNRMLVDSGFAQVSTYPPNVKYVDRFLSAQRRARAADRGLWNGCANEEPAAPAKTASESSGENCTPGYDPCLPPASDYDCAGGSGDGPEYVTGPIRISGDDPYRLDSDGDGIGCE